MNKKGILIVVSGFAGTGKGTVIKSLLDKYDKYALSVSATTRQPRPGEVDGIHYFFKTPEEFETLIVNDELLEHARYVDNYYGTPKDYVFKQLDEGKNVILEIEIQGALKIKEKYPDTVLAFLIPPSASELKKRLVGRGTETSDVIDARLKRASQESEGLEEYDYIIINDDIDTCVKDFHNIIESEHMKTKRNDDVIKKIREELKSF